MKFTDICFVTKDVMRLRRFYEAVFGGKAEGDKYHSGLALEGLTFTFDRAEPLRDTEAFQFVSSESSDNVVIGFDVGDVDAEYQRMLSLGADTLNQPTTHPWRARSFQFRDPDGNILNFRSLTKEGAT